MSYDELGGRPVSKTHGTDGIDEERWRHVVDRHPELKEMRETVNETMRSPDEVFVDARGTFHMVKRLRGGPSDFLVVVVREGGSRLRLITAYLTNARRKTRRYRRFKKLAPS